MSASRDPRIDEYIDHAEPFAQPILRHIRALVHRAVPEATETIKWGMPFFERQGILCAMASFKQHATFTIWKGALIPEVVARYGDRSGEAMGSFGRIASLADLPDDERIVFWLQAAADLNARNVKTPGRSRRDARADLAPPDDLVAALETNEAARAGFEGLSPSNRREYIEWLDGAKTVATRQKRLATAIEWMAEGKGRNWKYERPRKERRTEPGA